jgi:hypothetical protein
MNDTQHSKLKNLIDIHFESLAKEVENLNEVNSFKSEIIVRLNDLKNFNSYVNLNGSINIGTQLEEELDRKERGLSKESWDYGAKIDLIKSEYIKRDALLYLFDLNRFQLWITDWYNSRKVIEFMRFLNCFSYLKNSRKALQSLEI